VFVCSVTWGVRGLEVVGREDTIVLPYGLLDLSDRAGCEEIIDVYGAKDCELKGATTGAIDGAVS
jgi:hypothetical protein